VGCFHGRFPSGHHGKGTREGLGSAKFADIVCEICCTGARYGSVPRSDPFAGWERMSIWCRQERNWRISEMSSKTATHVAYASATSVGSLSRGFKSSLGVSPHNWLLNRRIALAERLIFDSDTPLSEVALSCGFADQSHLTRVFTRKLGSSPGAWRRNAQRLPVVFTQRLPGCKNLSITQFKLTGCRDLADFTSPGAPSY
jgi:AraC-like DNA-binding protein